MKKLFGFRFILILLFLVLFCSGCLDNGSNTPTNSTTGENAKEFTIDNPAVGLWHFNELAGDDVKCDVNLINSGIATGTTIVDGRFGKARLFNNTSTVTIPITSFNFGTNDFTIEMWVKINRFYYDSSKKGYLLWVKMNNPLVEGDRGIYWNIYNSDSGRASAIFETPGDGFDFSDQQLSLITEHGKWIYFAFVRNGNDIRVYLNGILSRSTNLAINKNNFVPMKIYLGYNDNVNNSFIIDEVRFSNKARTGDEINKYWNGL